MPRRTPTRPGVATAVTDHPGGSPSTPRGLSRCNFFQGLQERCRARLGRNSNDHEQARAQSKEDGFRAGSALDDAPLNEQPAQRERLGSSVAEFPEDGLWGSLPSSMRRYEVRSPPPHAPAGGRFIPATVGCVHGTRASLMVRIGGGHPRHLVAPAGELLGRLQLEGPSRLDERHESPSAFFQAMVGWLEAQHTEGFLRNSYTTASLLAATAGNEAWIWTMSPHGVATGSPTRMEFVTRDLRIPVLRDVGVVRKDVTPPRMEPLRQSELDLLHRDPSGLRTATRGPWIS